MIQVKLCFLFIFCFSIIHSAAWEYKWEITHEKTEIQGYIGVLTYCGKKIEPKIKLIQTPIGCFSYYEFKEFSSKRGWIRCKEYSIVSTDAVFSYEAIGNKWYCGKYMQKTPRHWCYLVNYDTWINPVYIHLFSEKYLAQDPELYAHKNISITDEIKYIEEKRIQNILDDHSRILCSYHWEYKISYEVKKIQQGRIGKLYYKNIEIPLISNIIKTPLGTYVYRKRKFTYQDNGWFLINDIDTSMSQENITVNDLKNKFYKGDHKKKTPLKWCFLIDHKIWLDPELFLSASIDHIFR